MAPSKGSLYATKKKRAVKLLQSGKLEEAAALLKELCARRDDDLEVWMFRGMAHGMRGEYEAVVECAERAIAIDPDNARAHSHLGSALAGLGRREESIAALGRARELAPDDPGILSNLGNALYLAERVEEAEPLFLRALAIHPANLEANYGLGHVLSAMGLHDEAIASYRRAAQTDPDNYQVLYGLGMACLNTGRLEQAEAYLQRALPLTADPVEVHLALTLVDRVLGRYDAALDRLQRVARDRPDDFTVLVEQADICQRMGDRERAYGLIRRVLDADVVTASLVSTYAAICRYFDGCDEVVAAGGRLLDQQGLGRLDRATVHFALGDVLNRKGEYDDAFAHYRHGNDLTPHRFDRAAHSADIDGLIDGYGRVVIPRLARSTHATERPIFIVGMPRSGTSLVEQILASHPQVYGAGELAYLSQLSGMVSARLGGEYYERLDGLDGATLDEAAAAYLHQVEPAAGRAERFTDKMPDNFLRVGLIGQLFPHARVIHCTRDPRDTCLSVYFQRFNRTHNYSWELGDLAYFYTEYQRLMAHWKEVLPIDMIEVNYETVVGDLEGEARRMVEFVGLPWDERCLAFHESKRAVATASFDQVRQPLYTESIGRWKHYERHLGPLIEGLGLDG